MVCRKRVCERVFKCVVYIYIYINIYMCIYIYICIYIRNTLQHSFTCPLPTANLPPASFTVSCRHLSCLFSQKQPTCRCRVPFSQIIPANKYASTSLYIFVHTSSSFYIHLHLSTPLCRVTLSPKRQYIQPLAPPLPPTHCAFGYSYYPASLCVSESLSTPLLTPPPPSACLISETQW